MNDYREKAEECLRAAEKMRNPAERIEMLGIARNYMALADHAGRRQIREHRNWGSRHGWLVPAVASCRIVDMRKHGKPKENVILASANDAPRVPG
jgi:hypothetical protein